MLAPILTNWKTSAGGAVMIVIGLLSIVFDVRIPGFTLDAGPAIATGIGLLLAKDANK